MRNRLRNIDFRPPARATVALACLATVLAVLASAIPAQAAFPGGNGKIAFGVSGTIETIESDGSGRTVLIPGRTPAWSADGAKIAYSAAANIFTANVDGSNPQQITNFGGRGGLDTPTWSPDGSRIAYTQTACAFTACFYSIQLVNSDGSGGSAYLADGGQASWSPLGDKIAYTGDGTTCGYSDPNDPNSYYSCNAQIYTINPDGTGDTRITDDTTADGDPNWSPDGARLAFVTTRHITDAGSCIRSCNTEIYVMNADGSGQTRLTNSPGNDLSPAWSPDGSKIAFTSIRDEPNPDGCASCNYELYVMNADGSGQTRLTNDPEWEAEPDWQPLTGPSPGDFKNAAQFCKAERQRLGRAAFRAKYGTMGKCIKRARDQIRRGRTPSP